MITSLACKKLLKIKLNSYECTCTMAVLIKTLKKVRHGLGLNFSSSSFIIGVNLFHELFFQVSSSLTGNFVHD